MEEDYSKAQMIGLGISFIIVPVIAVASRLVAKVIGRKGLGWDDIMVVSALVSKVTMKLVVVLTNDDRSSALPVMHFSSLVGARHQKLFTALAERPVKLLSTGNSVSIRRMRTTVCYC